MADRWLGRLDSQGREASLLVGYREHRVLIVNDKDRENLKWVRAFNPYDLYTKSQARPDVEKLRPFYEDLIGEYFPEKIAW